MFDLHNTLSLCKVLCRILCKSKLREARICSFFPLIYTTNAVESVHRQLRKVIKNKAVLPGDDALVKMLFLAIRDLSKKWTMPNYYYQHEIVNIMCQETNKEIFENTKCARCWQIEDKCICGRFGTAPVQDCWFETAEGKDILLNIVNEKFLSVL